MRARVRSSTRVDAVELSDVEWGLAKEAWFAEGSIAAVAKAAGIDAGLARIVVEEGSSGRPSLRLEVSREARLAVAKSGPTPEIDPDDEAALARAREKARREILAKEKAVLGDAKESREEEFRLVRANRRSALILANTNVKLLKVADVLAESLLSELVGPDGRASEGAKALKVRERVGLLRTVAQIVQRAGEASAKSVQMERLLLGEPTAILGHAEADPTSEMTPEEAEQWIALGQRVVARRARRRTVVEATVVEDPSPPSDPEEG